MSRESHPSSLILLPQATLATVDREQRQQREAIDDLARVLRHLECGEQARDQRQHQRAGHRAPIAADASSGGTRRSVIPRPLSVPISAPAPSVTTAPTERQFGQFFVVAAVQYDRRASPA